MSQKLKGMLNLSRIPKELITTNNRGEKILWISVAERQQPSQYGDTHNISCYDKATRQTIYIGDLRPDTFGQQQAPAPANGYRQRPAAPAPAPAPQPAPAPVNEETDLPF